MSKSGYVIARNRAVDAFFTKASAYDRPQWVPLSEASIFQTAELANNAARKLYNHGAYEARVVVEATDVNGAESDNTVEIKMVAQVQALPPDPDYDADNQDVELVSDENVAAGLDPEIDLDTTDADDQTQLESISESPIPTRPENDATPDENSDTVHDVAKPQQIKYSDRAQSGGYADSQLIASSDDAKIKVPTDVLAQLRAAKANFDRCAEFSKDGDEKGAFCMTVADAFDRLDTLLQLGTVGGLKQAQLFVASWMNPIATHLPTKVQHFVYSGGQVQSLKSRFDAARSTP